MISRLTTLAVAFAILASASLAVAATAWNLPTRASAAAEPRAVRIIELPRVVVTAKRIAP